MASSDRRRAGRGEGQHLVDLGVEDQEVVVQGPTVMVVWNEVSVEPERSGGVEGLPNCPGAQLPGELHEA